MTTDGRKLRRGSLGLAKRIGVNLRGDTVAALDVLSARTGYAPGVLAREAVEAGLPVVRDRYRRRAERDGGTEAS